MRNKLGEIEFYDGRVKDILYYIPLATNNEYMLVTKDGERYLVSAALKYNEDPIDSKFGYKTPQKIQVYIIKNNKYYARNDVTTISIRGVWNLFED